MRKQEFDATWEAGVEEALTGLKQWRQEHPRATLTEIETELDTRLQRLRAQLLRDLATASTAANWRGAPPEDRPICPACGEPLQSRGSYTRRLQTQGDQPAPLTRTYGYCSRCARGFFPSG